MSRAVIEQLAWKRIASYRGWTMVFVAFACMVFVFASSTSTMPLLYGPVIDEFGWSRTQTTLMFTYKKLASAFVALVLIGPLCAWFGLRRVTLGACAVSGLAMVSFLWVDSLWSYYAAGVVLGLGVTTTFVTVSILVGRWFMANHGLAIGVTLAGGSVGGFVAPLAYAGLEGVLGWRGAFAALSLGIWAIAIPLYFAKAKDDPSGDDTLVERMEPSPRSDDATAGAGFGTELRKPAFWLVALTLLLIAAVDAGLMQHTPLLLERDAGMTKGLVAAALSAMIGLGVAAKAGAGWVYDRYSLGGLKVFCVLLAVSVALALVVSSAEMLALFVVVRGIVHSALMLAPAIVARLCYEPRFGHLVLPAFAGVSALGTALGPTVPAALYDGSGTYTTAFLIYIGACGVAVLALSAVPVRRAARYGVARPMPRSSAGVG